MKIENWNEAYKTLPDAVFNAGYDYVKAMVPRADTTSGFPMWYGWAIREAFWSGWKYAKDDEQ